LTSDARDFVLLEVVLQTIFFVPTSLQLTFGVRPRGPRSP
jgi:hypothetical protein